MFGVAHVADEHRPTALFLDQRLDLLGVVILVEISDQDVGALTRASDRDGPPDTAIAACDHRPLALQLARPRVTALAMVRARVHLCGRAGHRLLLRWLRRL